MSTDRGGIFSEISMTVRHNEENRRQEPPLFILAQWESNYIMPLIISGTISLKGSLRSHFLLVAPCHVLWGHTLLLHVCAHKYNRLF